MLYLITPILLTFLFDLAFVEQNEGNNEAAKVPVDSINVSLFLTILYLLFLHLSVLFIEMSSHLIDGPL